VSQLNYQPEGRPPLLIENGNLIGVLQPELVANVDTIELSQGTVRYWGSGVVSLDAERRLRASSRPRPTISMGSSGFSNPTFDMTDQEKAGFRAVLGLLGNEAKADIVAKDGQLFIGPFKAADLLPLY
jgi:hypothetical protein